MYYIIQVLAIQDKEKLYIAETVFSHPVWTTNYDDATHMFTFSNKCV